MKKLKIRLFFAFTISFLAVNAQEKKIEFSKGTLKICSSKNFKIEGYDGKEIIIKSLHNKRYSNLVNYNINTNHNNHTNNNTRTITTTTTTSRSSSHSNHYPKKESITFYCNDGDRKKGLKKLGKKNENSDLGIYFTIEQNGDELVFKDNNDKQLVMISNEKYEIKIPNSVKLNWQTSTCNEKGKKKNQYIYFNSKTSNLSNFDGEVEISTSLNNIKLKDVTGPVSINSIGGNVTIEFDKKTPKNLYSIYSNNGFIDVTLPSSSDVMVDTNSTSIFSDIDFKVLEDKEEEGGLQKMRLKLKQGNVKMKLNAGLGNIYLRKK